MLRLGQDHALESFLLSGALEKGVLQLIDCQLALLFVLGERLLGLDCLLGGLGEEGLDLCIAGG